MSKHRNILLMAGLTFILVLNMRCARPYPSYNGNYAPIPEDYYRQFSIVDKHRNYHKWLGGKNTARGFLSFIKVFRSGFIPGDMSEDDKELNSMNTTTAMVLDKENMKGIDLGDVFFDNDSLEKFTHYKFGTFYTFLYYDYENNADSLTYQENEFFQWEVIDSETIDPFELKIQSPEDIAIVSPKNDDVIAIDDGLNIEWTKSKDDHNRIIIQLIPVPPRQFSGVDVYVDYGPVVFPRRPTLFPPSGRLPRARRGAFRPPGFEPYVKVLDEDNGAYKISPKELELLQWENIICIVTRVNENLELENDRGIVARMAVETGIKLKIK